MKSRPHGSLRSQREKINPNAMKTVSQTWGRSQGCFIGEVVSSCRVSPLSCALSKALISTVRRGWCLLCGWNWKWLVMEWALAAPPHRTNPESKLLASFQRCWVSRALCISYLINPQCDPRSASPLGLMIKSSVQTIIRPPKMAVHFTRKIKECEIIVIFFHLKTQHVVEQHLFLISAPQSLSFSFSFLIGFFLEGCHRPLGCLLQSVMGCAVMSREKNHSKVFISPDELTLATEREREDVSGV